MDFLKKFAESSAPKTETTDKSASPADHGSESTNDDLFSSAKLVATAARSTFQQETPTYDNAEVAGAAADLLSAAQTYGKLDKTAGVGSYVDKAENYLHEYETSHTTKPKSPEEPASEDKTTEEPVAKPGSEDIPSHTPEKYEEPTEKVKPDVDEPNPSSEDLPIPAKKEEVEEELIKEETKLSSEDVVPSESQKEEEEEEEETETTKSAKPTTEEPSYGEKEEEESDQTTKPSVVKEPETEIPSGVGEHAKIAGGFLKEKTEGDKDSSAAEGGKSDEIGEFANVAEGFLNKQSEGTGDSEKSGLGGIGKLAGGFFK